MRNVQVVDGAANCEYAIYAVEDGDFAEIFPGDRQDVAFVEDFVGRVGEQRANEILGGAWTRVHKKTVQGIHGTVFFELAGKRRFYPNRMEADLRDPRIQGTLGQTFVAHHEAGASSDRALTCPACGYHLGFSPWQDGSASDEICPCCGIHFGYDDECGGDPTLRGGFYLGWRGRWREDGCPWFGRGQEPPEGWDGRKQLDLFLMSRGG